MMPCKPPMVRLSFVRPSFIRLTLFFFATFQIPLTAQSQPQSEDPRSTIAIDFGQTSDKFGSLARTTAAEADVEAKFVILQRESKEGDPNIVAGFEVLAPTDTSSHAPELALYGGPEFYFGPHVSAGFHVQLRKLYVPSSEEPSATGPLFFNRYRMTLLELPAVLNFKFGPGNRVFAQGQIAPEFSPHYTNPSEVASSPHPNLDHGYSIRGSLGYTFGRWYLKATYQTRYLKFSPNQGNPFGLYNWRTDLVTGGVGIRF